MDQQRGHPVLVEFWDFCRPNSIRTLPYMTAWHERYGEQGLRVIGVHSPGFEPSSQPANVEAAAARLGIEYAIVVDLELAIWQEYENIGWPARYLWGPEGRLFEFHYGEGAYAETELAIQELLGVAREPVTPIRPEDAPEALLVRQSEDVVGPYSGPYVAGAVWAVLDGAGLIRANADELTIDHPGAYELVRHEHSTAGALELEVGDGVRCLAVCFTPGLRGDFGGPPEGVPDAGLE